MILCYIPRMRANTLIAPIFDARPNSKGEATSLSFVLHGISSSHLIGSVFYLFRQTVMERNMDDAQGKEKNGSTYSRRRFLRHSAALAGALVTYPLLSNPIVAAAQSAGRSSKAGRPLKVGVLLPRSSYYPDLATSFLAGMALYSGRS